MEFIYKGNSDLKEAQDAMRGAIDEAILLKLKEVEIWAKENDRDLFWVFDHYNPKEKPEHFGRALKQRGYEIEQIRPVASYDYDGGVYTASSQLDKLRIIVRKVIFITK